MAWFNHGTKNGLIEFVPGKIWIKPVSFRYLGINIGARMTIVRLFNNRLFIHSPVELDDDLKKEIDALGTVRYIISPNQLHHVFIGDYYEAYPKALIYASPGLESKRKDIRFSRILTDKADEEWRNEIEQTIFYGGEEFREVVFYHSESRTLIVADLMMYFHVGCPPLTRLVTQLIGIYNKPASAFNMESDGFEKVQARRSLEEILDWDFEKIILSHGRIIESNAKNDFIEAYSWLLEEYLQNR